jgi:putative ABC transport system substrate-binding protein
MNYKNIGLTVIILALIISIVIITKKTQVPAHNAITIGIIQTATHPALDEARTSFIETLQGKLHSDVHFVTYNAEGSIAHAHAIAQRLSVRNDIKVFYAIATPAAQAIAAVEKNRPIIIAAVTDPTVLGTQTTICGVHDMIDMHKEIAMLHQLLPNAKTVALLYNNAETNSLCQVQRMKEELTALGITSINIGIAQETDIPMAIALACRKADVLLCPTDNMIASAMELVTTLALSHKKPVIACHNEAVKQGALAACGVDYKACGKQAGEIAYALIMEGKKTEELPIVCPKTDTVYINQKSLEALNISIPETLQKDVVLIIQD